MQCLHFFQKSMTKHLVIDNEWGGGCGLVDVDNEGSGAVEKDFFYLTKFIEARFLVERARLA